MAMASPEVLTLRWQPGQNATWQLPSDLDEALSSRITVLQALGQRAQRWLQAQGCSSGWLALQLHDEDPCVACLRFDAPCRPGDGPPMIPDPYALASAGFAAVRQSFKRQPLPPWVERLPLAIWRGSSTGVADLCLDNLARNRRVQLCRWSRRHPTWLDSRITAVVQTAAGQGPAVGQQLLDEDLLAPRVTPWQLALHRWIIEIDGNVNSWGLLWKLLSGSCVLRVSSSRRQWYHNRLLPWVHVVPIAADLSDLGDIMVWCHQHPSACAQIATAGRELGLQVVAALEQDQQAAFRQWSQHWMTPPTGRPPIGSTGGASC